MQEISGLVSFVVPAYNAADLVSETIDSIFSQTFANWEIILVNDGSTDNTSDVVKARYGEKITVLEQMNTGVSVARNNGLKLSSGEFVVFLDADDVLTPSFLQVRVDRLKQDETLGFVGGWIESFPVASSPKKAVAENPAQQVLFFEPGFATVPSNYLFRKKVITENRLDFNPILSSTADRFFILQLSKYTKGICLPTSEGKLLYRVTEKSMSHAITPSLILDNELFYLELKKKDLLPVNAVRRFKAGYFYSLAGGFAKIKYFGSCIKYLFLSFCQNPLFFLNLIIKKR